MAPPTYKPCNYRVTLDVYDGWRNEASDVPPGTHECPKKYPGVYPVTKEILKDLQDKAHQWQSGIVTKGCQVDETGEMKCYYEIPLACEGKICPTHH